MNATTHSRKRAFKVALARLGRTAKGFAEEQGISQSHLYAVLNGERDSDRLTSAIDAFIASAEKTATAA